MPGVTGSLLHAHMGSGEWNSVLTIVQQTLYQRSHCPIPQVLFPPLAASDPFARQRFLNVIGTPGFSENTFQRELIFICSTLILRTGY